MKIRIHKNLDKYKGNVFLGMTAKQVIHSIICIAICVIGVLILRPIVGINLATWITLPFAMPVAVNGFYDYNGMSFTEAMVIKFKLMFQSKLHYNSTENEKLIDDFLEEVKTQETTKQKKHKRKERNKRIFSMFFEKVED